MIKKIIRIVSVLLLIFLVGSSVYYFSSSKKEKNKIKKHFLYKMGIYESDWSTENSQTDLDHTTTFNSSSLLIDDIYTSMEGPYTYKWFLLNENEDELYWIKKLNASVTSKFDSDSISNDFFCHANLYHSNTEHHMRLGLKDRISHQSESQIITLTKGVLSVEFPEGFGYPIFSNEKIQIGGQAVNLNKDNEWFRVNFNFDLQYHKNKEKKLKPLFMKYVVMAFPYESFNSTYNNLPIKNMVLCAGPESDMRFKNEDEEGNGYTGFWQVPTGKHTYRNKISKYLGLDKTKVAHYINAHVHPYATSFELRDMTSNTSLFKSIITNSKEKKGIENISEFSSIEGITFYPDHEYELVLEVNNTTENYIDMMGSMFIYFMIKNLMRN
ncbi:MAG: hypothetical protein JXR05_15005 [Flavobacteriaceae bacterium]